MTSSEFLDDHPRTIAWARPQGVPRALTTKSVFIGEGANPLEVAVAAATARPKVADVRALWKARHANRPSPVLVVVLYPTPTGERADLCGPVPPDPAVYEDLDRGQAERIAATALDEPDRHAAIRFLSGTLPETDTELPGIRNAGMLANHALRTVVPDRADWAGACAQGRGLLDAGGQQLVEQLGFTVEARGTNTFVLRAEIVARAVAVFLDAAETPDGGSQRFNGNSPVSQALAIADAEGLPYVVLTRGRQVRLYAARKHTGVGRKGRAETFVEANLALLPDDRAGYLPLLFGAGALVEGGTFEQILEASRDFATDLGQRLRDRVYEEVVPILAESIATRYELTDDDTLETQLGFLYDVSLTVLFRLLFLAYAEDKELLPYRGNGRYQRHALKTLARELAAIDPEGGLEFDEQADDLWQNVLQLFRAVEQGNRDWGVPTYGGSLFSADADTNEAGAEIADLDLTNAEIGPALRALLVDADDDGIRGPVDFRSLSVREFGTIYEGLLESRLSLARDDLTLDASASYVPAGKGDAVEVEAGTVYLHNRSGVRKATGSYFTKPFAVEHLLEHALEPALDDHLARLEMLIDAGEEHAAADAFFDFRCVDLAMGSGHFLVAAVDHIEARLSSFLALQPIGGVIAELERLRDSATDALGDLAAGIEIETATLLRRQVARRCIYGVDRNPIAVELARLSLWIHTFVPGLPLSFLNHGLVIGDSLAGIGTLDEAVSILDPGHASGTLSVFSGQIHDWLARAADALRRLGRVADATAREIAEARKAQREARAAVEPARRLFDLLVGVRLDEVTPFVEVSDEAIERHRQLSDATARGEELQALHFPVVFPEVFLRENPGFDCIIGNPPWEEATVEELGFWALRFPGLKSMRPKEQKLEIERYRLRRPDLVEEYDAEVDAMDALRRLLLAGPNPGMSTGDPDLYKAFTWRFWHLVREDGAIGVVLPRSALMAAGSTPWRAAVLHEGEYADITLLLNNRGWMFDDVHPQYTVGLVSLRKGADHAGLIHLSGPYNSLEAYAAARDAKPAEFSVAEFETWSEGLSFPLLPSAESVAVFRKLRAQPRLDERGVSL